VIPGELVMSADDSIGADVSRCQVDVLLFERLVRRAKPASLVLACRLYRGDFLKGLNLRESGFDEWLTSQRARLHQLAIDAHEACLGHHMEAGRFSEAIDIAQRLLILDPLQEWVHRTLMRLYAERGQYGAARRQYAVCVRRLDRELHVAPDAETQSLWRQISVGQVAVARPAMLRRNLGPVDAWERTPAYAHERPRRSVPHLSREHWHQRRSSQG
jgi:DNA-binding SARP family transcriptional activator